MKHTIKKTRNIALGLLTLLITVTSQGVFAAPGTDHPTEIKFLGKIKSQPIFQLNINNSEAANYVIVIKNSNNDKIYSETISGENLSRKYQVEISEEDLNSADFGLIFEVTSLKTNLTQTYKISQKTQWIQGFEVAKL